MDNLFAVFSSAHPSTISIKSDENTAEPEDQGNKESLVAPSSPLSSTSNSTLDSTSKSQEAPLQIFQLRKQDQTTPKLSVPTLPLEMTSAAAKNSAVSSIVARLNSRKERHSVASIKLLSPRGAKGVTGELVHEWTRKYSLNTPLETRPSVKQASPSAALLQEEVFVSEITAKRIRQLSMLQEAAEKSTTLARSTQNLFLSF
ncbi:hypothetical protein Ciccas_006293 [Cichlidogyrus casuarinus]|uniref:Uncharacterized protein n=1 Tax=Cichlidogyrus casuarinus TaxID=1844966 RepID=A0ABD2Q681_9PLAT